MNQKEFNAHFKSLPDSAILQKLEEIVTRVDTTSGHTYLIANWSDLRGVVEQELYDELVRS